METNFYLQTIEINDDEYNIIIQPKKIYYCSDEISKMFFIIYEIIIKNIKLNITKINYIPYYLSDGRTNGFKCNMLFPFLCVSTFDTIKNKYPFDINQTNCPIIINTQTKHNPSGLVYKLIGCNNINIQKIEYSIDKDIINYEKNIKKIIIDSENIKKENPDEHIQQEIERNIKINIEKLIRLDKELADLEENFKQNNDMKTVLMRIISILDFLIAISTKKITNLSDKIINIDNLEEFEKYEHNFIPTMEKSYIDTIEEKDIELKYKKTYRKLLMRYFVYFNKLLSENSKIKISYKKYNYDTLDNIIQLNRILSICEGNNISYNAKKSFNSYILTSKIIHKIFKKNNILRNILLKNDICKVTKIEDILNSWGSSCNPHNK